MKPSLPPSAKDLLALHGESIAKAGTEFCRTTFSSEAVTAEISADTASLDAVEGAIGTYRMLLVHNFGFLGATVTADAQGNVLDMRFLKV